MKIVLFISFFMCFLLGNSQTTTLSPSTITTNTSVGTKYIEYVAMSFIIENEAFYNIPMSEAKDFFNQKISSML